MRPSTTSPISCAGRRGAPLIVVLDGVEDPHNFGAILRVADAAGVDGVVRQTRRAAAVDGVAAKASAGRDRARPDRERRQYRARDRRAEGRQRLDRGPGRRRAESATATST